MERELIVSLINDSDYVARTNDSAAPEWVRLDESAELLPSVVVSCDIWAFGCVCIEFLEWSGRTEMADQTEIMQLDCVPGYEHHDHGSKSSPDMTKKADRLRASIHTSDTLSRNLLDLLEHDVLQVDPSRRVNAAQLRDRLHNVLQDAEKSSQCANVCVCSSKSLPANNSKVKLKPDDGQAPQWVQHVARNMDKFLSGRQHKVTRICVAGSQPWDEKTKKSVAQLLSEFWNARLRKKNLNRFILDFRITAEDQNHSFATKMWKKYP